MDRKQSETVGQQRARAPKDVRWNSKMRDLKAWLRERDQRIEITLR